MGMNAAKKSVDRSRRMWMTSLRATEYVRRNGGGTFMSARIHRGQGSGPAGPFEGARDLTDVLVGRLGRSSSGSMGPRPQPTGWAVASDQQRGRSRCARLEISE